MQSRRHEHNRRAVHDRAAGQPHRRAGPDDPILVRRGPGAARGTRPGRARLLEQLETFTDARVERYWQLLAIINGQPVPPSMVPGFEWLIAALRADLS